MAYKESTLQKTDVEFLATAENIEQQCALHVGDWHLESDSVNELTQLTATARQAYEANSEIATKNRTTSEAKKAAFSALKHFLGIFINALEGNLRVPDAALALMGLRPRTHHAGQPLPAPKTAPVVSVDRHHDELIVYVARPEHDQPTATVAPAEYYGFLLRWKWDDAGEWKTVISTRLHCTLQFEHADRGKSVILSAAWVNPRLQPGPFSDDLTEVIS